MQTQLKILMISSLLLASNVNAYPEDNYYTSQNIASSVSNSNNASGYYSSNNNGNISVSEQPRIPQRWHYHTDWQSTQQGKRYTMPHWVPGQQGGFLHQVAVAGGIQFNPYAILHICRVNLQDGAHPGKLYQGVCFINVNGRETGFSQYEVLVSRLTLRWENKITGPIPANAIIAGYANGNNIYLCQARFRDGVYPGTIANNGNCAITWKGGLLYSPVYNVLVL